MEEDTKLHVSQHKEPQAETLCEACATLLSFISSIGMCLARETRDLPLQGCIAEILDISGAIIQSIAF
jgi:hypothetical protein